MLERCKHIQQFMSRASILGLGVFMLSGWSSDLMEAQPRKPQGSWYSVDKIENLQEQTVRGFLSKWGYQLKYSTSQPVKSWSDHMTEGDKTYPLEDLMHLSQPFSVLLAKYSVDPSPANPLSPNQQQPIKSWDNHLAVGHEMYPLEELVDLAPQPFSHLLEKYSLELPLESRRQAPDVKAEIFSPATQSVGEGIVIRVASTDSQAGMPSPKSQSKIQVKVQVPQEDHEDQLPNSPMFEKPASHEVVNLFEMIRSQGESGGLSTVDVSKDKQTEKLALSVDKLDFSSIGDQVVLRIDGDLEKRAGDIQVFVRNGELVQWDESKKVLQAIKEGQTEVYFLHDSQMYILPVTINQDLGSVAANLEIPESLTSIDRLGGFVSDNTLASYRSFSKPTKKRSTLDQINYNEPKKSYFQNERQAVHNRLTVQLVDERTTTSDQIFPVSSVSLKLLGTKNFIKPDAKVRINNLEVPSNSRFLVEVFDPTGQYLNTIKEISTAGLGDQSLITIKLLRNFMFNNFQQVIGEYQKPGRSSFCGQVTDGNLEDKNTGFQVVLDPEGSRPFYFNKYGYLDPDMNVTGPDGRFCYFNVVSGPLSLDISKDQGPISTYPLAVFRDKHHEFDFQLADRDSIKTHLTAVPTAHEQVEGSIFDYNEVDMVDLFPMGYGDPLMQLDYSMAGSQGSLTSSNDRIFYLSQASEFESTLYSYSTGEKSNYMDESHITPLFPRGFVEDMSVIAEMPFDPVKGALVIEHGKVIGQEEGERVSIRLVDSNGHNVTQGVDFSGAGDIRHLFFNIEPGLYTVMVETSDGFWLAADTAMIYSETLSYIRTGSSVTYKNTVSYLE